MIINLTQHSASDEQIAVGVVDLQGVDAAKLKSLLTFDELPTPNEMCRRAASIALLARGFDRAMIGGAPYFMSYLEDALGTMDVLPMYAFTKRVAVEVDGVKTSLFKHEGFVI